MTEVKRSSSKWNAYDNVKSNGNMGYSKNKSKIIKLRKNSNLSWQRLRHQNDYYFLNYYKNLEPGHFQI